jgi:hypothetical protein
MIATMAAPPMAQRPYLFHMLRSDQNLIKFTADLPRFSNLGR